MAMRPPKLLVGFDIRRWQTCTEDWPEPERIKRFSFWRDAPGHPQYASPFGFQLLWPLCFHVWFQFRPQATRVDENGVTVRVPGSEKVLYVRLGWARWDAGACDYFHPTFFAGLHWD